MPNKPIFIVEGIDRSGKTTFVNELVSQGAKHIDMSWAMFHDSPWYERNGTHTAEWERLLVATRFAIVLADYVPVVFDRFHLSQYVYGQNKMDSSIHTKYYQSIDSLLGDAGATIVLLSPDKDSLDTDGNHSREMITEQYNHFHELVKNSNCKILDVASGSQPLLNMHTHALAVIEPLFPLPMLN